MTETGRQVTRRRVFHIPGYDPIHPRRYRELYRKEGAEQAKMSGYEINVLPKAPGPVFGWHVAAGIDGVDVKTQVDVLIWSDIVRASMAQSIPATYWQLLQTAWIYIATGTLRRLMWMRKGPVIAALYPVGMLLLQLATALLIGRLAGRLVQSAIVWPTQAFALDGTVTAGVLGWLGWALMLSVWVGCAIFVLRWFKARDNKLFAYYLMHDYAFSARLRGRTPQALTQRLGEFKASVASALQEDLDEVLIIGHSSGAHLAVSIVADILRNDPLPTDRPRLALLTLGQVVPMVSFLPDAGELRRDLAFLASHETITWIDVSAPGDGCSFALCDPVAVTGVAPPGKRWPLVISAAFTQSLSEARWKALRWRFFRLHFQYLCAFDRPKDYDYFQITAGPLLLADRYAGRQPSRSRIDVAASKYTSLAA